jgi:hypothetical protein
LAQEGDRRRPAAESAQHLQPPSSTSPWWAFRDRPPRAAARVRRRRARGSELVEGGVEQVEEVADGGAPSGYGISGGAPRHGERLGEVVGGGLDGQAAVFSEHRFSLGEVGGWGRSGEEQVGEGAEREHVEEAPSGCSMLNDSGAR